MALNPDGANAPTTQQEFALWNALSALQRHGLDNPDLLDNRHYMDAIKRAQQEWAEVFEALQ